MTIQNTNGHTNGSENKHSNTPVPGAKEYYPLNRPQIASTYPKVGMNAFSPNSRSRIPLIFFETHAHILTSNSVAIVVRSSTGLGDLPAKRQYPEPLQAPHHQRRRV